LLAAGCYDRIAACWVGIDMLGLMVQLGIVPSPWQREAPDSDTSRPSRVEP
jgi:hypothetical protein